MIEYLDNLAFALLIGSAFGLVLLVFGYIFEKVVEKTIGMDRLVNIIFGPADEDDEEE